MANENDIRRASEVLYDQAQALHHGSLTYAMVPEVVTKFMEIAQSMSHLTGEEKKRVVVGSIKMCIDDSFDGHMEAILLQLVPSLVDSIIDVDRGHIVIDKRLRSSFLCCIGK